MSITSQIMREDNLKGGDAIHFIKKKFNKFAAFSFSWQRIKNPQPPLINNNNFKPPPVK